MGAAITMAASDALQTSTKVLMNEHPIFFALDFRLKLYSKTHISCYG